MKKFTKFIVVLVVMLSIFGCAPANDDNNNNPDDELTLEMINDFLNNSADMGPGSIANAVAIVPIAHIDGPRNESKFFAFVNFKYKARDYIKYQITYLSCTCRAASVNYWQTAYVELTLPESKNADDVVVKFLSFDRDPSGEYLGGFWGDSNPTPAGATYSMFKNEFISHFANKTNGYIKTLSTMDDIKLTEYKTGDGRADFELDTFTGSSVSTNNIIRMLHALMTYHVEDEFFD
jgi:hypothetical protein